MRKKVAILDKVGILQEQYHGKFDFVEENSMNKKNPPKM